MSTYATRNGLPGYTGAGPDDHDTDWQDEPTPSRYVPASRWTRDQLDAIHAGTCPVCAGNRYPDPTACPCCAGTTRLNTTN